MPVESRNASEESLFEIDTDDQDQDTSKSASLDDAFRSLLQPVEELIGRIAQRQEELEGEGSAAEVLTPVSKSLHDLRKGQSTIYKAIVNLSQRVEPLLAEESPARLVATDAPSEKGDEASQDVVDERLSDRWERVILGPDLCVDESVSDPRQRLLDDVLVGAEEAVGLAARIMLAQSASRGELPSLLKDLGEAFYRWQPKKTDDEDPLEQALADWLQKRIEEADLRNRIDLVRVGERFDAARHLSSQRGMEVSEVHGWVVLRDNGKSLSKANVSLK